MIVPVGAAEDCENGVSGKTLSQPAVAPTSQRLQISKPTVPFSIPID